MVKFLAEFFVFSILLFAMLLTLTSLDNRESSYEIVIYISLVASIFNVAFISVLEFLKISNFRQWGKGVMFVEITIYFLLIWMIEELVKSLDFMNNRNPLFDFPFTFIYPFIGVFLFCLFCKIWYLGENREGIENDDILDA